MIKNLDIGFFRVDLVDGKILSHNPTCSKILGLDPEENLIGKKTIDFYENPEERTFIIKKLKGKGFIKNHVVSVIRKDGKKIIIQMDLRIIKNDKGEPIYSEGTFVDITDKYYLEQKLRESEEKFRMLADQSLMGIGILQDGVYKYFNNALATIDGYEAEEIQNWEPYGFLELIYPDDREFVTN